jgi:hypothetical protein
MKQKLFFSLSFNNQDIYYIEFDSINNNSVLIEKITEANKYINELIFPEKIIVHLEQTSLNNNGINLIIDFIGITNKHYKNLCFVGIHDVTRLFFKYKMKQNRKLVSIPWTIINDYQKAKEWIVSKDTQ